MNEYPTMNHLRADLANIISTCENRPTQMPHNTQDAADWWIHRQEQHQQFESPQTKWNPKTEENCYIWPYADRIKNTLKIFLTLSPKFQSLIISAKEDGISWRGDSEEMFLLIIEETMNMQEIGIEKYRKQARLKMREMF